MTAAQLWDEYLQAVNARDVAIDNAAKRVAREFAATVEMRRLAYMAAVEREAKA